MSSIFTRIFLVTFASLYLSSAHTQTLYPYLKGDLYGYADSTGKVLVEPMYEKITLHGLTTFFSEKHDPRRRQYQDKDWPGGLALAVTEGKWYLLDKRGQSVLGEGTKGKIKILQVTTTFKSTTSPYHIVKTDSIADGWGIWNETTQSSEGLIYTYFGGYGLDGTPMPRTYLSSYSQLESHSKIRGVIVQRL